MEHMEESKLFAEDIQVIRRGSTRLRDILLVSWAAIATALFLVTLTGGVVFMIARPTNLNGRNLKEELWQTKIYHYNLVEGDKGESEDVHLKADTDTQFVIKKNNDSLISIVSAVTNHEDVISTCSYLSEQDVCVMTTEMKTTRPEPQLDNMNLNYDTLVRTEDNTRRYTTIPSSPVTDMSLVPVEMRSFCQGKTVYIALPEPDEQSRHRRAASKSYDCYYYSAMGCWFCYHIKK